MKKILILTLSILGINAHSQQKVMTKELLWQLGRVSPIGLSEDGKYLYYKVGTPDVAENKINTAYYSVSIDGKRVKNLENADGLVADKNTGPGNEYVLSHEEVKITKVLGKTIMKESKNQMFTFMMNLITDIGIPGTTGHLITLF